MILTFDIVIGLLRNTPSFEAYTRADTQMFQIKAAMSGFPQAGFTKIKTVGFYIRFPSTAIDSSWSSFCFLHPAGLPLFSLKINIMQRM